MNEARYARHIALPEVGRDGQARLSNARVVIVGLGGLGCPAAQMLASSGIGTLCVVDFDTVDVSNLPRQILYQPDDAGRPKVEAAGIRLSAINPDLNLELINRRISSSADLQPLLESADVVLDGTDNFAVRFAVNDACVASGVPLVSGAAIRLEGQVVVFPNDGSGACYRCIYNEDDEWLGDCEGNGVLAPVTAVVGSMMALETIKVVLGMTDGEGTTLRLWDARSDQWNRVAIARNSECQNSKCQYCSV